MTVLARAVLHLPCDCCVGVSAVLCKHIRKKATRWSWGDDDDDDDDDDVSVSPWLALF